MQPTEPTEPTETAAHRNAAKTVKLTDNCGANRHCQLPMIQDMKKVEGRKTTTNEPFITAPASICARPVLLDLKGIVSELRATCPLPTLLKRMGLESYAKPSCRSPLRPDQNASWGIFHHHGRWQWKDFGTDEHGDEVDFIMQARGLKGQKDAYAKAVSIWSKLAEGLTEIVPPIMAGKPEPRSRPNGTGFGPGTDEQLSRLSLLRDIEMDGLSLARDFDILVFGNFMGHEVYGVTDSSGNALEVRRLDGQPFPASGNLAERKSHALKGSDKSWPVGLEEVFPRLRILLVEGLPDLLAAFEVVAKEDAIDRVLPVAMLSANARIGNDALRMFEGMDVRIVPHLDPAGQAAAATWEAQLLKAGAHSVTRFDVAPPEDYSGKTIKDLNDFLPLYRAEIADGPEELRMLSW